MWIERLRADASLSVVDLRDTNFCATEVGDVVLTALGALLSIDFWLQKAVTSLAAIPTLTTLRIDNTPVTSARFEQLCQQLPKLTSLSMANCKVTADSIRVLSRLTCLEYLDIRCDSGSIPFSGIRDACLASTASRIRVSPDCLDLLDRLVSPSTNAAIYALKVDDIPSMTVSQLEVLLGLCGGRLSGTKDVLVLRLTETIKQLTLNLQFSQRVIRDEYTDTEFLNGKALPLRGSMGNIIVRRRTTLASCSQLASLPSQDLLKRPRSEPHGNGAIVKRLLTSVELPSSVHFGVSASLSSILSPKRSSREAKLDDGLRRLAENISALKVTYAKTFRELLFHCTGEFRKELPPLFKMVQEHGTQAQRLEYERLYEMYSRMKDQLKSMANSSH